jgi:hypothetical protein
MSSPYQPYHLPAKFYWFAGSVISVLLWVVYVMFTAPQHASSTIEGKKASETPSSLNASVTNEHCQPKRDSPCENTGVKKAQNKQPES